MTQEASVPIEELQALVKAFNEYAENNDRKSDVGGQVYKGIAIGRKRSAHELLNKIKEYEDE